MNKREEKATPRINIEEFIAKAPVELKLELIAGKKGVCKREIVSSRIQKLGLALTGFSEYTHSGRIQFLGQSEILYLDQLSREKKRRAIRNLNLADITCILITKNLRPPSELIRAADEFEVPVIGTPVVSSTAISLVTNFLQAELAPQISVHGILLGMYGLGVLLTGDSGIGKSECALDLISRGHRLISDDVVLIKRIGDRLEGKSPELTAELMEIRGLGILNIRELFGVSAVGKSKGVDLCIELKSWDKVDEIDRLGLEVFEAEIFEIKVPKFVLPVSPGRNLSTLVETAIRLHLLKLNGFDAARQLIDKHSEMLIKSVEN